MKFESSETLNNYFKETEGANHPLSKEEVETLVPLAKAGDQQAMTRVLYSCSKLIVKLSNKYMGQGVPVMDLIQEGNLGAIEAVSRFKHGTGASFVSYASLWIRKYINDSVATVGRTVRLPMNKEFEIFKLKRAGKDAGDYSDVRIDKKIANKEGLNVLDFHAHCESSTERDHDLEYTKSLVEDYLNTIKQTQDREMVKAFFGIGREVALCGDDLQLEFGINKAKIKRIISNTIKELSKTK